MRRFSPANIDILSKKFLINKLINKRKNNSLINIKISYVTCVYINTKIALLEYSAILISMDIKEIYIF